MTEAQPLSAVCTVACPQCGAGYQVPVAKLAAKPRKLKCAQCAHVWLATLPAPLEKTPQAPHGDEPHAAVPVALPNPASDTAPNLTYTAVPDAVPSATAEEPIAPLEAPSFSTLRTPAWHAWVLGEQKWLSLAFLMALAGLGAAGVSLWHQLPQHVSQEVVVAPTAYRPPQAIAAPPGVVLHQIQAESQPHTAGAVLQVSGKVANTGNMLVALPRLQADLLDESGAVADFWPVKLVTTTLPPQSEIPFVVSFTNPAASGWRLVWVN